LITPQFYLSIIDQWGGTYDSVRAAYGKLVNSTALGVCADSKEESFKHFQKCLHWPAGISEISDRTLQFDFGTCSTRVATGISESTMPVDEHKHEGFLVHRREEEESTE
jgi:hypothetical protein